MSSIGAQNNLKTIFEQLNQYYEKEQIKIYNGILFSKAHRLRGRYIPFEDHDSFLGYLEDEGFIYFINKENFPHEKGFITEFDKHKIRYHLIVSYKYLYFSGIQYFFWVRIHQDEWVGNRHYTIVRGFPCPFCNSIVTGRYQYGDHFKTYHNMRSE